MIYTETDLLKVHNLTRQGFNFRDCINSIKTDKLEMCEGDILRMRFHENSSVKKMKTRSVFEEDGYKQIVVSTPVNLVGYGEGVIHYSCIPISE